MTPDPSGLYGDRGRTAEEEDQPRVVIRDRRRIDPETGAVREPPAATGTGSPAGDKVTDASTTATEATTVDLAKELAERTEDLQRVSAEYANYRRRVDRDRVLISELAQERLVLDLLPVLDDIDRAREHGDLTGAFKSTADRLSGVLDRAGVEAYGEVGDPFDPGLHEAVLHAQSADVSVPTCTSVLRRGYRRSDRVLRAAMVGVADPTTPADPNPNPTPDRDRAAAVDSTEPSSAEAGAPPSEDAPANDDGTE